MEILLSRESARNLATTMEYYEGFLKDIFSALLSYDSERAAVLGFQLPAIVSSWEQIRVLVNSQKISSKPFSNRPTSGTAIRKWLTGEFPILDAISKGDNVFDLNYATLTEVLVDLRHDITHRDRTLGSKSIAKLTLIKQYLSVEEIASDYLLIPTEKQVKFVLDKLLECAFAFAKTLSIQYKLSYAKHTYSNKPEIMLREGRWSGFRE
ncbi:hypothetical protein [Chitinophaga varians]|uniref:hypothetical protein n=1 Tax=Chitinophaga varians TaxID=2202339 RepID=UPI00165FEBF0|nr:hypothetical protein [Chitinophaga varians]MBC9909826.1 hypothetical protein [Chitinophaga varians]